MREFQEKKKYRKIFYSKGMLVVLLILIAFFSRATWSVYKKEKESMANAVQADKELRKMEERQSLLQSELGRLSTDEGIEEEIRTKFGVIKPGESLVVIVDNTQATATATTTPPTWWSKFKGIFKKQ